MGSLSIWHWIDRDRRRPAAVRRRGKISDLMGDVAQGIKAFKKGMTEDEQDRRAPKTEPIKTHRASRRRRDRSQGATPRPSAVEGSMS